MTVYSKKNRVIINNEKSSAELYGFGRIDLVYKDFGEVSRSARR